MFHVKHKSILKILAIFEKNYKYCTKLSKFILCLNKKYFTEYKTFYLLIRKLKTTYQHMFHVKHMS